MSTTLSRPRRTRRPRPQRLLPALRLDIERQQALLRLGEMAAESEREIVDFALEEAVRLTASTVGYLHFVESDQVNLQLFTWSRGVLEQCYAESNTHYPIAQAGIWADCIRERRPVFHNDYQHEPGRHGYPAGHIHIERHLSVPLIDGDKVVAVAGVGNKARPYDEADARQLLLFMGGMWALLQRKRVEAALRESEARYRRLTEQAPDIIYRYQLHPEPRFEYVSPAVTAITGYTPADHYADPDLGFKLVHPDDRTLLARMAEDATSLAGPVELRWVRRDGSLLWVEQRNVAICDEAGALVAIEGIAREITDRKQADERLQAERVQLEQGVAARTRELREERDRTHAVLEAIAEAVIVVDATGRIEYLNPAAAAVTGLGVDTPAIWGWWRTQTAPGGLASLRAALVAGRVWRGEALLQRADGTAYEAAMTVAPLFDPDAPERPIRFVSVHRDVTAVRTAERMKDQFVSNVSHELRSPVSLITMLAGNLEMLYHRLDDARRLEIIADIRSNTRALTDLIGSVLEISRIDGGRGAEDRRRLDLLQLARDEAARLEPIARRKAIGLVVESGDALPVIGQEGQLRQVLRNMLSNAIKYTPEGGFVCCTGALAPGELAGQWPGLGRLPARPSAALRVADTGIGIGPQDLPHIFERFYRAETQGNIPGTGLGLSIAWELARRHGGTIEVSSTPGAGSCFVLYLPLEETP
jgi:PAS domain S-box-containing protein